MPIGQFFIPYGNEDKKNYHHKEKIMRKETTVIRVQWIFITIFLVTFFGGCSKAYYGAMEKVGIHKRDILVDRVEGARDA